MDYDEIKFLAEKYLEEQSNLTVSQKILNDLLSILSNSKRYIDYCTELNEIFENNIEVILLAEFFFLDCSIVLYERSIIKLAILLDDKTNTVSIKKLFNILKSVEAQNQRNKSLLINKQIEKDIEILQRIRTDFNDFKNKRDKEIVHYDMSNYKKGYIKTLDFNMLYDIQTRIYGLIKGYFELLDLPKPSSLDDLNSIGLLAGLDTLKSVSIRGLSELDFSEDIKVQKILKSLEIVKILKENTAANSGS